MTVTLRPLAEQDLDAVMIVEEASFVQPWSRRLFVDELSQPSRRYVVANDGEAVRGYGGIMVGGEEATVVTLAVAPGYREQGVASLLLMNLVERARRQGARHLTLEVRESNQPALELYRKFGFEQAGKRKGYYTNEDAVVICAVDIDSSEYEGTLDTIRKEAS